MFYAEKKKNYISKTVKYFSVSLYTEAIYLKTSSQHLDVIK